MCSSNIPVTTTEPDRARVDNARTAKEAQMCMSHELASRIAELHLHGRADHLPQETVSHALELAYGGNAPKPLSCEIDNAQAA